MSGGPRTKPELVRFLPKIEVLSEGGIDGRPCWRWTAYVDPKGYGRFGVGSRTNGNRRMKLAHRWAYEYWIGPLPPFYFNRPNRQELDHLCRNRWCVNPSHLEVVTGSVNCLRGNTGRHHSPRPGRPRLDRKKVAA